MNWRPYPYIALAFFSRRSNQFMLVLFAIFAVVMFQAIFGFGPATRSTGPDHRINWKNERAYLPPQQRLQFDRAGLISLQPGPKHRLVSHLEFRNSSKTPDGRSNELLLEPLGRDELARIVQCFPALRSLKIWARVSAEGWTGLAGAHRLEHLDLNDGTGKEITTLESLPHLPALKRIIIRDGDSAAVLKGLGRNNPQVQQLMFGDLDVAQRGQNLPLFPLEGLPNVTEVAIHPSFEPAEGELLVAKWDPNHAVMSGGYRLSPPSAELVAALQSLPGLKRVYCCDPSAGDWGIVELRNALGAHMSVEQGTVVRLGTVGGVRNDPSFAAIFVSAMSFFFAILLTLQAGATFSTELGRTVPGFATAHIATFAAVTLAAAALLAIPLTTLTDHGFVSLVYSLFLVSAAAVAFGGSQLLLRPKPLATLARLAFLLPLILGPALSETLITSLPQLGPTPHWLYERTSDLLTLLVSPPPLFIVAVLTIGVACAVWFFDGLPRLPGRILEANSRTTFFDSFDQGRATTLVPADGQGPEANRLPVPRDFPGLETPVVTSKLLDRGDAIQRLGLAFGNHQRGPAALLLAPWSLLFLAPYVAILHGRQLLMGDIIGGLLIPMTRFALMGVLVLLGLRLVAAITRRPCCPYEAILPMTRDDYHAALERLHARTIVYPTVWAALWCALGALFTLWHNGGDLPIQVIFFHGVMATMVPVSGFAAAEFASWALTVRSDATVVSVGCLVGIPLLQCLMMTTLLGQLASDNSPLTVIGLIVGNIGGLFLGLFLYVLNAVRYHSIEWGKVT